MSSKTVKASTKILYLAALLWVISITLPALIFYGGDKAYGFMLLLIGWAGILSGSFAWFANPLFIYCVACAQDGKKIAYLPALFAVILASTTFLFSESANFNIGSMQLYGYGIGFYLWLTAMCLNLLAASVQNLEDNSQALSFNKVLRDFPCIFALILIVFYAGLFTYNGIYDHTKASSAEKPYLDSAMFKQGEVCELPDVQAKNSILLEDPLEVEQTGKNVAPYDDILSHPENILAWGIPIVRKDGFDYALANKSDASSVYAKPAEGYTSTALYIDYSEYNHVKAKLTNSNKNNRTLLFDANWTKKTSKDVYCPRYIQNEKNEESPLKTLLKSALRLTNNTEFKGTSKQNSKTPIKPKELYIISHKIIGYTSIGLIKDNIDCPDRTGLFSAIDRDERNSVWRMKTQGLAVSSSYVFNRENKTYFVDLPGYYLGNSVVCNGEYAYLLITDRVSHDKNWSDTFFIQKRNIDDFQNVWVDSKSFKLNHYSLGILDENINYKLLSAHEENGFLTIKIAELTNNTQGAVIEIKAN